MKCEKCGYTGIFTTQGNCVDCGWKHTSNIDKYFWKIFLPVVGLIIIASASGMLDGLGGYPKDSASISSSSTQWFQGGNLHNATIAQWKKATYQNKLATSSDWLAATKWKGHLNSPKDFDKIKVKAQVLLKAMDETVTGEEMEQLGFMKVTDIAASLVTMSNDLGP